MALSKPLEAGCGCGFYYGTSMSDSADHCEEDLSETEAADRDAHVDREQTIDRRVVKCA